jgi:2-polyprenyl-3-methyl-5-hydroxy-6-metoxy-1,4-benzoquinol methylase
VDICVVCRARGEFRPFWTGLKQCVDCGHIMADMNIKGLDLKEIYGDRYFSGDEYENYLRDRAVFEKHFKKKLKLVKKFQPVGDLIEIGCAYGFFLEVARRDYHVLGFDISEGPVAYARQNLGVDARCEDFLDAAVEPESADMVVMWDVVEHLPRPDLTIEKASRVLRPGGFLALTTGDIGSVMARMRGGKWRLVHPPTHLHYFNRKSIMRLLESSGLKPVLTKYVGVRRSLRQIAYSLLMLGKQRTSRLYRIIANSRLGNLSFVLNTYDIILVVAKKTQVKR